MTDEFGPASGNTIAFDSAVNSDNDCGITIASHTANQIYGNLIEHNVADNITIVAAHDGTPVRAGTQLILREPRITLIVRLGPGGIATVRIRPRSPGTLTVSPRGIPGCAAKTITISAVSPAEVTG